MLWGTERKWKMGKNKRKWIDKTVLWFMSVFTIMFLFLAIVTFTAPQSSVIFVIVNSVLGSCIYFSAGHMWPIRIVGNIIYLARDRFPSFGQRAVSFEKIKTISITGKKRFDEMGRFFSMRYLRMSDKEGNKYRNILASEDDLKVFFAKAFEDGIVDQSFMSKLPKSLTG